MMGFFWLVVYGDGGMLVFLVWCYPGGALETGIWWCGGGLVIDVWHHGAWCRYGGSEGDKMVGHMAGGLVLEAQQIVSGHEFW